MDKFKQLLARCKCGVYITVNEHRDSYESVEHWLANMAVLGHEVVDQEVKRKMIEMDTIIDLQFYPDTPIGFYKVLHFDIDAAFDAALASFQPGDWKAVIEENT